MQNKTCHLPTPLFYEGSFPKVLFSSHQVLVALCVTSKTRLFWAFTENIFLSTKTDSDLSVPFYFGESSILFLLFLYFPFLVVHYLNLKYFF